MLPEYEVGIDQLNCKLQIQQQAYIFCVNKAKQSLDTEVATFLSELHCLNLNCRSIHYSLILTLTKIKD
jgi:hypothetical protein